MDAAGILDLRAVEVDDLGRARNVPSLQLVGDADGRSVDLNALAELGVRLAGRLAGLRDGKALFSGGLANQVALSDLKMNRLLDAIDAWAARGGVDGALPPPERFAPTRIDASAPLSLDLAHERIRTVLWATGFRPDHSWLEMPVFDRKGRLRHDGGVAEAPGLYVLGLPFLRRKLGQQLIAPHHRDVLHLRLARQASHDGQAHAHGPLLAHDVSIRGDDEGRPPDQMRGEPQQDGALAQTLLDQGDLTAEEIAQAAVDHARRPRAGAGGHVAAIDQQNRQSPQRRVPGDRCAGGPGPHHRDVEPGTGKALQPGHV
jgi:hypothetical protein